MQLYEREISVHDGLRNALKTSQPTFESNKAEPLSVDEIDAHPDSARIWATLMVLRGER